MQVSFRELHALLKRKSRRCSSPSCQRYFANGPTVGATVRTGNGTERENIRECVKEKRPELEELCRKDTVRRDNEERSKNHSSSNDHPLLCDNPHGIVPFLEIDVFQESSSPNLDKFSATPRLFSTHMTLHAMQEYSSEFVTTGRYVWFLAISHCLLKNLL
ncbi:hypothetical protein YC2023_051630 [Brassica napus]